MFASTVLEWYTKGGFDKLIIIDGIVSPDKQLNQENYMALARPKKPVMSWKMQVLNQFSKV